MATSSNIRLHFPDGNKVVFYQHWDGDNLFDTLKAALKRGKGRWNDLSYLARIIFCEMVKDDIEGATGFGITTDIIQEDWFTIEVIMGAQTVEWIDRSGRPEHALFSDLID